MTEYYFDTETTDLDPTFGKVITIQWRQLHHGQPDWDESELHVETEWEVGEAALVEKALEIGVFDIGRETMWDFIPVGNNLTFDLCFLYRRALKHDLVPDIGVPLDYVLREKPRIDIRDILVLMNDFSFRGSGLHSFTKKLRGNHIPYWYGNEQYDRILEYVDLEQREFISLLREVRPVLMILGDRLRKRKALLENEPL